MILKPEFQKLPRAGIAAGKKFLLFFLLGAMCPESFAGTAFCSPSYDDADVVACAQEELQEQVGSLQRAYDELAEALGPRAASGLPDDQEKWVRRVSGHCEVNGANDFESMIAQARKTTQALCLQNFVAARIRDLRLRRKHAVERAASFASAEYPIVQSTWGDHLNPQGKAPLGRFSAYYLRSGKPSTVVAIDTVDEVSIRYPWSQFHEIKSEDFEAYWVGRFRFEKETPIRIEVDQSWARTRVIVDRRLIYEGSGNARVPFVFGPGTHTVEVEHKNNWHTTGLSVTFSDAAAPVGRSELRAKLQALAPTNAIVQHAAVYESGSRDNVVVLKLAPSPDPVILALSSYHAVRWVVDNPHKVDVRAIVYGSYAPGSRVQTDEREKTVPRLLVEQALGSHDVAPRCNCVGGIFHCEGGSLGATVQTLSSLLGFQMKGFAGEYSSRNLSVPGIVVTPQVMADARDALEQLGKERGECRKSARIE